MYYIPERSGQRKTCPIDKNHADNANILANTKDAFMSAKPTLALKQRLKEQPRQCHSWAGRSQLS